MRSPVAATIEQLLGFFIRSGVAWVDGQRSHYRSVAKPLDDHGRQRVARRAESPGDAHPGLDDAEMDL